MEFAEISPEELRGGNFLQSEEMYRRYLAMGREVYLVGIREGAKVTAFGLMMARQTRLGKVFRAAGGWVMDYNDSDYAERLKLLTLEVKKFVQDRGGVAVMISPEIVVQAWGLNTKITQVSEHLEVRGMLKKVGYKYIGEYEQPKWIYALDLAGKTETEIWDGMRQSHRRMLRKAEKEQVRVRELGEAEYPKMMEIMQETGERQGFQEPDLEYFQTMKESFGKKVRFMVAERPVLGDLGDENTKKDGKKYEMLAVGMFVRDEKEVIYLYGGSRREAQKYGGSYALQWKMIREAIKQRCEKYNFYGTQPKEGNGVYLFKQGFRGQMEELLGTFILPIGIKGRIYAARIKPQEFRAIH